MMKARFKSSNNFILYFTQVTYTISFLTSVKAKNKEQSAETPPTSRHGESVLDDASTSYTRDSNLVVKRSQKIQEVSRPKLTNI